MKSLGLFAQFVTLLLSIAIVFVYIMPTFEEISAVQNEIAAYELQIKRASEVNLSLQGHVKTIGAIPTEDIQRLQTYMPPTVDEIAVMRDIRFIINQSRMMFKTVAYSGSDVESEAEAAFAPKVHEFTAAAEGTYSQVKNLLSLLEQNEYPLEAYVVELSPLEGGFLTLNLTLRTYENDLINIIGNE